MLMDEPLGALDKKLRDQMQLEIKRIHRELGTTIVYVTHDQEEAMTMSDRICLMNGGRIEQLGTPGSSTSSRARSSSPTSSASRTCSPAGRERVDGDQVDVALARGRQRGARARSAPRPTGRGPGRCA